MKKIISLILTAMLLVSCTAACAESAVGYTPADVVTWFEESDQHTVDATDQARNAAYHLGLALVYVASLNANEEQLQSLQGTLEAMVELKDDETLSASQKLGVSCAHLLRPLAALCREADLQGMHAEQLQGVIDQYNATDAAIDTSEMQTVNALYTAIKLAAMAVEMCCTSQDQIDQIKAGLETLNAENEAAENAGAQMVVGAKWLRKMLGAFAKLNNANCVETIDREMALREERIAGEDMSAAQLLMQYLTSSVYAMAIFTGDYTIQ